MNVADAVVHGGTGHGSEPLDELPPPPELPPLPPLPEPELPPDPPELPEGPLSDPPDDGDESNEPETQQEHGVAVLTVGMVRRPRPHSGA